MTDADRIQLADDFLVDWFEAEDDMEHPDANPRALCGRVLLRMALVGLVESTEQRTQQAASGGPLVDIETVVRLCVGDV